MNIEYKGYTIKIEQDEFPECSRDERDNLGTMICFHRKYNIGDKHTFKNPDDFFVSLLVEANAFSTQEDAEEFLEDCYSRYHEFDFTEDIIKKLQEYYHILPIYMYDHSGITINTTGFSCRWDSGKIGWIYVSKEDCKDIIAQEQAEAVLKAEVQELDYYLTGEIYEYSVTQGENEEILDSCSGYYGNDHEKSGLLAEAREFIDNSIKEENPLFEYAGILD